jgi:hypothetical protein
MANLLDCRAQEALCRIHALTDEQHRDLWLSMAERWSYLALEEARAFRSDLALRRKAVQETASAVPTVGKADERWDRVPALKRDA